MIIKSTCTHPILMPPTTLTPKRRTVKVKTFVRHINHIIIRSRRKKIKLRRKVETITMTADNNAHTTTAGSGAGEWIQVKGEDIQVKVIGTKPSKLKLSSDDPDEPPKQIKYMDNVLIDIIGRQSDNISHLDGPIFQDVKGWLIGVGENDVVVKCIKDGLEYLCEGQTACIWSSPKYALGETGTRKYKIPKAKDNNNKKLDGDEEEAEAEKEEYYTLPKNSSVLYEITVNSIVMDTSRLNPYFTIQKAMTKKNIANDLYQWEWLSGGPTREKSIRLYEKSGKSMQTLLDGTYFNSVEADHPQRKECRTIMLDSFNNIVAVYMRARRYQKAKDACKVVLKIDSNNLKALLRYAKICILDYRNPNNNNKSDETTTTTTTTTTTEDDVEDALKKAENAITYKDAAEEDELKKLKAQWKRKKAAQQ